MKARGTWASDGEISLPKAIENTNVEMADFEGFCFTPDGLRVNLSSLDREVMISDGFTPPQGVNQHGEG